MHLTQHLCQDGKFMMDVFSQNERVVDRDPLKHLSLVFRDANAMP